jgi:hypothetical protein
MATKNRELMLPKLRAQAAVVPTTLDEEARTFEVRFYSGAEVQRYTWDEDYLLSFSLENAAVRLDRFNAGAPLLDNHDAYGPVSNVVLGVVEKGWIAADGGRALVKIAADRPDIMARVKDGVLRNFSMGAVVHQMRDITEKGDAQKRLLAIDWEPMELSIVPVPADMSAQALAQAERFPCQLTGAIGAPTTEVHMDKIKVRLLASGEVIEIDEHAFDEKLHSKTLTAPTASSPPAPKNDLAAAKRAVDDAIEKDRAMGAEVERLGHEFGMDELWIARHKNLGTPIEQVIKLASEERAKRAPVGPGGYGLSVGEDRESVPWRMDRMAEALAARGMRTAPPEPAKQYARHSIAELALEYVMLTRRTYGERLHPRHDAEQIFKLALHTTSDFPLVLNNVLNKMMLPAYELKSPSYKQLGAQKTFNDFRAHPFVRPGDFPIPKQVGPGGEYQYGTMGEASESVTALKYGVILGLALETLINDDMGAFQDTARQAGRRAADFENATFYSICIAPASGLGPSLRDALAVYDAGHSNTGSSGALSVTLLDEARAKLAAQTSIDGLKLNVSPAILLTSPTSAGLAERLLAPQSALLATTVMSDANNWAGKLRPVMDANLTGTRFYVLADPADLPQYIYGTIGDAMGPRTEVRNGFNVDGVEFKLSIFFGCGAVEYRAGYTAAGS